MAGKSDIVNAVIHSVDGVTKKQAAETFDAIFEAITEQLSDGDRIAVAGFGSFSVTERAARKGRNPATGEEIHIPASKNVRFKSGKALKDAVNG
ncbi:MAG: HU family DNA-binding protein [Acidobacteriota bacterium]|jgi:DNA-binding protein HU-beta